MPNICKNCGKESEGAYCSHCGQNADTHEMNFHFLKNDFMHELLPFDKGIIFTLRQLFTRPGYTIREYIEGKRVRHIKPLAIVLVLAGIFGFLFHYFNIRILNGTLDVTFSGTDAKTIKTYLDAVNNWVAENYAVVSLIQLPIYSLGTFLMFRKKGYNYVSHLVLNSYLTGQRLFIRIVCFPLFLVFTEPASVKWLSSSLNTIGFVLTVWTLVQFFEGEKKFTVFWRTLVSYVIFFAIFLTLSFGVSLALYYYFVKGNLNFTV